MLRSVLPRATRPLAPLAARQLSFYNEETHVFSSHRPAADLPTDMTLSDFALQRADELGDATYIVDGVTREEMSFGQFATSVREAAAGLAAKGLSAGDTLGLVAPNLPHYPVAMMAALSLGAKVTTCNPLFTASELAYQFDNSSTKMVITVPPFAEKVAEAAAKTGTEEVIMFGEADGYMPFAELLRSGSGMSAPAAAEIDPMNDVALLPYSSGTTGMPKGVMLSHYNVLSNIIQINEAESLAVDSSDTIIGVLPFFHIYGMVVVQMAPLATGCRLVTMPSFDPELFLTLLSEYKVTQAHIVPPIVNFLAKHPLVDNFDLSSLRSVMSGAAPLGVDLSEAAAARLGVSVRQGYGLSELSPVSHTSPLSENVFGAAGRLVRNTEGKITHLQTGEALPRGETGEVCIRGPQVMLGYLNNEEATAETIDSQGWLHTGDIGYVDEDDQWFVVDRAKELIKVKGHQVAPAELEAVLVAHPAVAMAAVIGIPDDRMGEVPKAFVTLKPGAEASEADIKEAISSTLSSYKALHAVEFTDDIPVSASGKILRRELRDRELRDREASA